jgi:hypothetical protein
MWCASVFAVFSSNIFFTCGQYTFRMELYTRTSYVLWRKDITDHFRRGSGFGTSGKVASTTQVVTSYFKLAV